MFSLEQVSNKFYDFIAFLIKRKPKICIHIEPIVELLDENIFLDYLSKRFHIQRNYLNGLLPFLQILKKLNRVPKNIIQTCLYLANTAYGALLGQEAGFFAFASEVLVSHAYIHLVDVSVPVTVGGLTVSPGDIIMGDKHGVVSIPKEIAADVPAAAAAVAERERVTIELCQSPEFTVEKLKARILATTEKKPDH